MPKSNKSIVSHNDYRYAGRMQTTIDPRWTERRRLDLSVILFGIVVIFVLANRALALWHQISQQVVRMDVTGSAGAVGSQTPNGAEVVAVDEIRLQAATSDVSTAAVVWLRSSELLETICLVAVLATAAIFIRCIAKGRLFDAAFDFRFNLVLVSVFLWMILPSITGSIGIRTAMHDLDLTASDGWGMPATNFWGVALILLVLGAMKIAFRSAGRLARDQQGTI